jgi:hypothetical protein
VGALREFLRFGLFAGLVVAAASAWVGCAAAGAHGGGGSGGGDAGFGDDGGGSAPTIQGLVSIALSPAASSLTLTYPVTSPGATTQLTATGTFQDGHTADVTQAVSWAVSPGDLASVGGGLFGSLVPGSFTVTALAGSVTSNPVTVSVKLTGNVVASGIPQADLDGSPAGSAPTIAYPLDGALFPYALGPIEFQVVPTSGSQTEARIAFEGDQIDLKVYAPCTPIANATSTNACSVTIDPSLETVLDGASEGNVLTETVRLAAPGGGSLAESAPISARWSSSQLKGGLYFWSASPSPQSTLIMRYNLDMPGTPPEQYFTQNAPNGMMSDEQKALSSTTCFGCHAISLDGTKLALAFGGSASANFALLDVASKTAIASRLTGAPFATFTAFSPDGTAMLQSVESVLVLRSADKNLSTLNPNVFGSAIAPEMATTPFWSPKGDLVAFTGWVPDAAANFQYDNSDTNGDQTPNSEIWAATVTGDMTFGTPYKLVPQVSGKSEYYPAISDDSAFVVFNESSCNGPPTPGSDGYGLSPCDSYDDPSATLRLVSTQMGATPVYLTNASGTDTWTNSWPRFAPTHGTFQGKTLYWVAFSSRRPYGARLPGSNNPNSNDTEPQLWFAAIAVDPSGNLTADPSFAPVWMPQQNPSGGPQRGNHSPQWVTKAVATVL